MALQRANRSAAVAFAAVVALSVTGCEINRETQPARTATEELIVSSAIDRMVDKLEVQVPKGTKIFVDGTYYDGLDSKYALGAIRDRLLRAGAYIVDDKKDAEMMVEARTGAESIDKSEFLVGIPQTSVPVPLSTGVITIPEIALFKRGQMKGVAKAAITGYDAKTGELRLSTGSAYGYSHDTDWTLLIFISWSNDDLIPKEQRDHNAIIPLDDPPGK
jgi:hypothetical protein